MSDVGNFLMCHVARFSEWNKIKDPINVPHEFIFKNRLFFLCGVVLHLGDSPLHGHYVSLVRIWDEWFLMDDASTPVRMDPHSDVFTQCVQKRGYMLMFSSVSDSSKSERLKVLQSCTSSPTVNSADPHEVIVTPRPRKISERQLYNRRVSIADLMTPRSLVASDGERTKRKTMCSTFTSQRPPKTTK